MTEVKVAQVNIDKDASLSSSASASAAATPPSDAKWIVRLPDETAEQFAGRERFFAAALQSTGGNALLAVSRSMTWRNIRYLGCRYSDAVEATVLSIDPQTRPPPKPKAPRKPSPPPQILNAPNRNPFRYSFSHRGRRSRPDYRARSPKRDPPAMRTNSRDYRSFHRREEREISEPVRALVDGISARQQADARK